jgi:hypothetical protein
MTSSGAGYCVFSVVAIPSEVIGTVCELKKIVITL